MQRQMQCGSGSSFRRCVGIDTRVFVAQIPQFMFSEHRIRARAGLSHTVGLENTEDLVACDMLVLIIRYDAVISRQCPQFSAIRRTCDDFDLSDTVAVAQNNTDLRGCGTLAGELADVVDDLVGGRLEPGRNTAGVWDGGGGNALALAVKTTHVGVCWAICRRGTSAMSRAELQWRRCADALWEEQKNLGV
jgi:hypothetical protein